MFDSSLQAIGLLFAGLSVVLVVMIPAVLSQVAPADNISEWRDVSGTSRLFKMLRPLLRMYSSAVEQSMSPAQTRELTAKLQVAGLSYVLTPAEFVVLKRFGLVFGLLFSAGLCWLSGMNDGWRIVMIVMVVSAIGFIFPDIKVRDLTKRRQLSVEKHFPFFLDLVVLCMRAGLPFTGAVQQGIEKMVPGALKEELLRYQRDIRTGIERREALEMLAKRVSLASMTNFVASIIQADESGGSITGVLQSQAQQRRKERFLRAEKLANEAPVKMLLPLVGLLFPLTFMIISVPIVVQFLESGLLGKVL